MKGYVVASNLWSLRRTGFLVGNQDLIKTMETLLEKLAELRREYVSQPLAETLIAADPIEQFRHWFDAAMTAGQPDVEVMHLATVAANGRVSGRVVLSKGFSGNRVGDFGLF